MDEKLVALSEQIRGLDYVIMRNWETMPPLGDIDFFVSRSCYQALLDACNRHLGDPKWFDIRKPGDNYYPKNMEDQILGEREKYGEWWVLNPGAHFVTLMYHQLVHKGDHRYQKRLDDLFLQQSGVVKPNDEGVGFHVSAI